MAVNEVIVSSFYRRLIDKSAKLWQRISYWTRSSDVEFNDGRTAEEKLGDINGITSDFSIDDESISASSHLTHAAYNRFQEFTDNGRIVSIKIGEDGKPYIEYKDGADTVLKKLGNGTVMYLGGGSSYDISELYDDYKNLTAENFIVECASTTAGKYLGNIHGMDNLDLHAGVEYKLKKAYDSSNGKLTISVSIKGSAGFSQAEAIGDAVHASVKKKVYLIVLPE